MLSTDRRRLRQGWVLVPFVTGMTVQEARATLRSAGLTGMHEIVVLTEDDCWLDGPSGRVTATNPPDGLVVPPGATITAYVNPGPTTPLSADERSVNEGARASSVRHREGQEAIFRERPTPTPNPAVRPAVGTTVIADAELLDRFERTLRDAGALVADALAPGLSDQQIDELLLPAGIDLPEEARVWWRWHNGARPDAPPIARAIGHRDMYGLDTVVELYESHRAAMVQFYDLDGLLAPVGEKPHLYSAYNSGVHAIHSSRAKTAIAYPKLASLSCRRDTTLAVTSSRPTASRA